MKTSVYKVQCRTYQIMKELFSVTSDVSRAGDGDPRYIFRVVVGRRSPESLKLRKRVADEVRARRKENVS